jgi:hypothetical protein
MRYFLLAVTLLLAGCRSKPASVDDFATRAVTLPGGQVLRAETMIENIDLIRGLMFRTSLAPDHGMLFVHPKPDYYTYWMYQTLIPLDIIWLDSKRNIVEMVDNAQPCKTVASQCERYGGHKVSAYVLEIKGGMANKYGLTVGQTLQW